MSSIKIQRISSELLRHLSSIIFEEVDNEIDKIKKDYIEKREE